MFPKEFTQLDVQNVCDFFPTIRRFNALRKLIKDRLLLSFIGPQKSGKSTVISRMWELSTGAAADVNTSEPTAYFAYNSIGHKIDEIPILDWPALTDKDKNRTEMQKLVLPFASACAIVVTVQNANESPVFDILRFVNDEMDCSYVILLNKVDVLYQEIKNDVVSRKNNTNDLAQLLQESQTTPDERQEAWDRFWSRVTTFIGEITSKYPKSKGKIFPTCYSNESLRFLLKEKANMSKYDLNSNIPDDFEVEERVVYAWHGTKKIFAHLLSDSIPDHLKNIWETLMKRTISESQAQNVRKEHPQPPDTSSL